MYSNAFEFGNPPPQSPNSKHYSTGNSIAITLQAILVDHLLTYPYLCYWVVSFDGCDFRGDRFSSLLIYFLAYLQGDAS